MDNFVFLCMGVVAFGIYFRARLLQNGQYPRITLLPVLRGKETIGVNKYMKFAGHDKISIVVRLLIMGYLVSLVV